MKFGWFFLRELFLKIHKILEYNDERMVHYEDIFIHNEFTKEVYH